MNVNKLRKIRDFGKMLWSIFFFWLYIPHFICYYLNRRARKDIDEDVKLEQENGYLRFGKTLMLLYLLHSNRFFRTLFYHRIGLFASTLISWYRPGDREFVNSKVTKIAGGALLEHPFSSGLNASYIGHHFRCRQLTTVGKAFGVEDNSRPIIGNYVTLGANVTITGGVRIGNGVFAGAGSVIRTDIPPYAMVLGNPAKVIGFTMTPQEIFEKEKELYPEAERTPLEVLEKNYDKYFLKRLKDIKDYTRI